MWKVDLYTECHWSIATQWVNWGTNVKKWVVDDTRTVAWQHEAVGQKESCTSQTNISEDELRESRLKEEKIKLVDKAGQNRESLQEGDLAGSNIYDGEEYWGNL